MTIQLSDDLRFSEQPCIILEIGACVLPDNDAPEHRHGVILFTSKPLLNLREDRVIATTVCVQQQCALMLHGTAPSSSMGVILNSGNPTYWESIRYVSERYGSRSDTYILHHAVLCLARLPITNHHRA